MTQDNNIHPVAEPVYGSYLVLSCRSHNGNEYEIDILKKDYTFQPYYGVLGGTPRLRRDKNDSILGTSLEFPVECQVDGELAEFYTSDATQYRVELKRNGVSIFVGYLMPELYSEPDIAPPYDVIFTAVDGLGELKRYKYNGGWKDSVYDTLTMILSHTGLQLPVLFLNHIGCPDFNKYQRDSPDMWRFWWKAGLDIRHLDGKSCYTVLQRILQTFNARLFQASTSWIFAPEGAYTSTVMRSSMVTADDEGGPILTFSDQTLGSVSSAKWWPIDYITSTIVPAARQVNLKSPDAYRESMLEDWDFRQPGALSAWTESFTGVTKVSYKNAKYCRGLTTPEANIRQHVRLHSPTRLPLELVVRAIWRRVDPSVTKSAELSITLAANCKDGRVLYAQYDGFDSVQGKKSATLSEANTNRIRLYVPEEYASVPAELKIDIPYNETDASYIVQSVDITIAWGDGHSRKIYPVVTECLLCAKSQNQSKGLRIEGLVNSVAREDMPERELLIPAANNPYRVWGYESVYGMPFSLFYAGNYGRDYWRLKQQTLEQFCTYDKQSTIVSFDRLMAMEYAKSCGLPRLRLKGCLNVPHMPSVQGENNEDMGIPLVFTNRSGIRFLVEEIEWSLCDDEMDVSLLSLPQADVAITDIQDVVIDD